MPIGAAIGGGVIAAGGSVLAGSQASRAQRDAARTASDTTLQSTRENNALLRETRDQNLSIATPFMNNGLAAGNALTDLLLGTNTYQPTQAGSAQVGGALSGFSGGAPFNQWDAYLQANPDLAAEAHRVTADGEFASPADYAQWHYQHYGQQEGRQQRRHRPPLQRLPQAAPSPPMRWARLTASAKAPTISSGLAKARSCWIASTPLPARSTAAPSAKRCSSTVRTSPATNYPTT
jgi:hypothetical protein